MLQSYKMNGYNSLNVHLRKDGTCKKSTVTINIIDYSGITHCEIIINKSKTQRNIIIFYNKSCREIQE